MFGEDPLVNNVIVKKNGYAICSQPQRADLSCSVKPSVEKSCRESLGFSVRPRRSFDAPPINAEQSHVGNDGQEDGGRSA